MGVMFKCPACGQQAEIVTGGFVLEHRTRSRVCSYTQTANNSRPPKFVEPDERTKKRIENIRIHREAARKKKVKLAGIPRPKRQGKAPGEECENCGSRVQRNRATGELRAHRWATNGAWCKGGEAPTEKQREKARKKGLVARVVSGGLPGSARRH